MIRCSVVRRAVRRPAYSLSRLSAILNDQRWANRPVEHTPWITRPVERLAAAQQALFAPLFASNDFVFENHQLTMLGDTLVDAYLSEALLNYFLSMGMVTTTNTAKLVNAVFHNHFSMRKLAEDIGMLHLSTPADPTEYAATSSSLDFLESMDAGLSYSDVAGTSFEFSPLSCGQSALGWKFSHFIGAMHQCYGKEAVHTLLDGLLDLRGTSNIIGKATEWLYELVKRYSPLHVAEALLAAQGIAAEFVATSRYIGPSGDSAQPFDDVRGDASPQSASTSVSTRASSGEVGVVVQGFEPPSKVGDARGTDLSVLSSTLAGPEFVNALEIWKERAIASEAGSASDLDAAVPSGWLSPEEHAKAKRGAAFTGFVDFSTSSYLADVAGVPHPEPGKRVSRVPFVRPVRDKQFFDKLSDFRDGVPMDTLGQSVPAFLKNLNAPHHRMFEVSLVVDGTKVLGRATATRYSDARLAVSQAYLVGTLRDLNLLGSSARASTPPS